MTEDNRPKGLAERQRQFRERQRAAGFTQRTLWIHADSEEAGRRAAASGDPCNPLEHSHPESWAIGWVDEMARMGPEIVEHIIRSKAP